VSPLNFPFSMVLFMATFYLKISSLTCHIDSACDFGFSKRDFTWFLLFYILFMGGNFGLLYFDFLSVQPGANLQ
jgi:hypothetical protein